MSDHNDAPPAKAQKLRYQLEYDAFARFLEGKSIPVWSLIVLIWKSCLSLVEMLIRNIPGGFGYKLRYYYYKLFLRKLGKNVLIDVGVFFCGPRNISIDDYTWIDAYCRIEATLGEVTIGKRIHIAPFSILASREPIILEDYVGLSSGVKIYSNSARPKDGRRMSGPMIPERMKSSYSLPIILKKDSFVGTNSVLLPGAMLEEGAVLGANSVLSKRIETYHIASGHPAKVIGKREKVTVPDL